MEAEELLLRYNILKRYHEGGERDFQGINLNEANLSLVNLSGANLSGGSFCVANLSGANLTDVNLSHAILNVARMSSVCLVRAILNNAIMNVANLVRADLTEAQLIETSLIRAELIRSELSKSNFSKANMAQTDLREAKINHANFSEANLNGSNLRGVAGIQVNFGHANLHSCDLTQAYLKEVNFSNADLRQTILTQANLNGGDLSNANLRWADLSGVNLSGADLSNAKLSGANFYGANLSNANLGNASLVHADLSHANLLGVDWYGADLSGATLTGAKLYQVSRFGLKAEEMSCEWIDISPKGDRSEIQRFNSSEEAKSFFNHRPPTIILQVDSPLDPGAHSALATAYYQIAKKYPLLVNPPSIEVGYRQTSLSFTLPKDEHLFSVACMVIIPFIDAIASQKNIITMVKSIQSQKIDKRRIISLSVAMNEAINKMNEFKKHNHDFWEDTSKYPFFSAPTQMILSNSSEKHLTVYVNPNFGKRLPSSQPYKFIFPSLDTILAFIDSFYYFN